MIKLNYKNEYFDVIVDVFSSCHLNHRDGLLFLSEVKKIKKRWYLFFIFSIKKKSNFFKSKIKKFIDKNTISKIYNKNQVYGNACFAHEIHGQNQYKSLLRDNNLKVVYNEYISKTYKEGKDTFVFNVLEAVK